REGDLRTPTGETIGTHSGVWYYTLGQRGGLGIGGKVGSNGEPWYVVGKDVTQNLLYVAQGGDSPWLHSRRLLASGLNWIAGAAPGHRFTCTAKTRYRQADQACEVRLQGNGCMVTFVQMQRAVTPGQSVVFYDGELCLGGGIIECSDAPMGGWEESNA
ncbi:MAG: aminomethyltransferase beta-barrel domain-containing protein, partial [Dokdonella sp.]